MQSAGTETLDFILLELLTLNSENCYFVPHTRVRSVTSNPFEIFMSPPTKVRGNILVSVQIPLVSALA